MFLLAFLIANSQGLIETYKKNQIVLEEDPAFGTKNNWKELFYDIGATRNQGKDGQNKEIVVAPDGRIYMSHHSRHSISLYDKDGNFVKEFGQRGGKKESDFIYMPTVLGIMDGKYLVTSSVDGRMLLFDLDGNWVKTIRLDYLPIRSAILKNGKIALLGHTSWTTKSRQFVAIRDIDSGKEKIIWDKFEDIPTAEPAKPEVASSQKKTGTVVMKFKYGGMWIMEFPYSKAMFSQPQLLTNSEGNLILAFPETGEVKTYSADGILVKSISVSAGERLPVTKEDREAFYKKLQNQIKEMEEKRDKAKESEKAYYNDVVEKLTANSAKALDPEMYPEKLPTMSNCVFDSDNNLLVFAFTKEKNQNRFFVYTYNSAGQKVAESSFVSDKYNLNFGSSKFRFYKGSVIAVQTLKDEKAEVPVRLVKFNLKN